MNQNELELIEYLKVLWKRKFFIILGTLSVTVIALIVALLSPKIYRATVVFLVASSPVIRDSQSVSEADNPILAETYRGIIKNKSSLIAAQKKFNLDQKPYKLSLPKLEKIVSVRLVSNSRLILLNVDFKDPQLASDLANYLAGYAVDVNYKLSQGDTLEAQRFLNDEITNSEQELRSSEKDFLDFQKLTRMADLRKKNETFLQLKSAWSQELANIEIDLKSELGKESKLATELSSRSPKLTLKKSMTEDPAFQQLMSSIGSTQQKDLLRLSLDSETVNEAYGKMDQDLVTSRVQIEYLQSRYNILKTSLAKVNQELKSTQIDLAKLEMEEQRLRNRYQLASTVYQEFRKKLEEANINVIASRQDLKILDAAIPPSSPEKAKKLIVTLVAIFSGMVGFMLLALFLDYLEKIKAEGKVLSNH